MCYFKKSFWNHSYPELYFSFVLLTASSKVIYFYQRVAVHPKRKGVKVGTPCQKAGWVGHGWFVLTLLQQREKNWRKLVKVGQNGREESEVNFPLPLMSDIPFEIHLSRYIDMFLCVVFVLHVRVCFLVFTVSLLSWLMGAWLDWWAWPACFPLISPRPASKTSRVLLFIVECEFNIFMRSNNYVALHIPHFVLGSLDLIVTL